MYELLWIYWQNYMVSAAGDATEPSFDLGRPIRGIDDLERLVGYIYQANPKNESDWLEWKIGIDLRVAEGRFGAAKHILGFANRHPDHARRHVGGLAYLVLGVEPGSAPGQPGIDPADLVAGLRGYLGTQRPSWDPSWVPFRGVEVLVVTVEAPAWGDPIHTLRKTMGNFSEGAIFVRHPGRTDPASPEDIVMLSERVRRHQGLDLELLTGSDPPCTLEASRDAVEAWLDDERDRLLGPLRERHRPEQASPSIEVDGIIGMGVGAAAFQALAADVSRLTSQFAGTHVREDRDPVAYEQEVERYIESCRALLPDVAAQAFLKNGCSQFTVIVVNRSERNLPGVKVELLFDETTLPADDDREDLELPASPRRWGPRLEGGIVAALAHRPEQLLGGLGPYRPPPMRAPDHEVSERTVVYWVGHLRPGETYRSEPVPLLARRVDSGMIKASWSATSKDIDGIARGTIQIPVGDSHALARYLPEHPTR